MGAEVRGPPAPPSSPELPSPAGSGALPSRASAAPRTGPHPAAGRSPTPADRRPPIATLQGPAGSGAPRGRAVSPPSPALPRPSPAAHADPPSPATPRPSPAAQADPPRPAARSLLPSPAARPPSPVVRDRSAVCPRPGWGVGPGGPPPAAPGGRGPSRCPPGSRARRARACRRTGTPTCAASPREPAGCRRSRGHARNGGRPVGPFRPIRSRSRTDQAGSGQECTGSLASENSR